MSTLVDTTPLIKENTTELNSLKAEDPTRKQMEVLTEIINKLTLLVTNSNINRKPIMCHNCKEDGELTYHRPANCKICKGDKGKHMLRDCPDYDPNYRRKATYLVAHPHNYFNKEESCSNYVNEALAVEERPIEEDKDNRVSRSGKRIKVHDTIPVSRAKGKEPLEHKLKLLHLK